MASQVYFGNASKQTWIKAPASGMKASSSSLITEQQLLNGRTFVNRSKASHRRFEMSWFGSLNEDSLDASLHTVKDFYDGVYGDGPFFWVDPYASTTNLFSPAWASPSLVVGGDWPDLFPAATGVTASAIDTTSNTQNYPVKSAQYVNAGTSTFESNRFTFYIPAGFTLWLGFHGSISASGGAYYVPTKAGTAGSAVKLTELGVTSNVRMNKSISSTVADKVEFYFAKTTTDTCTFVLAGLMAQLLPTGTSPEAGTFLSGRGTTGLEFATAPEIEYYSANINNGQVGLSLTMVEI